MPPMKYYKAYKIIFQYLSLKCKLREEVKTSELLEEEQLSLRSPGQVAQLDGALSQYTKVTGLIPCQSTDENQPMIFLFLTYFFYLLTYLLIY